MILIDSFVIRGLYFFWPLPYWSGKIYLLHSTKIMSERSVREYGQRSIGYLMVIRAVANEIFFFGLFYFRVVRIAA
jgi:hypothetical protein